MRPNILVDLFSDTLSRPTAGMRKAMAEADVGDEQKREDPTTTRLQERIAEMLGKEAALFLPSGTMCNQIAVAVHCRPGEEMIAAENSHLFTFEGGGASVLVGAQARPIETANGKFTGAQVVAKLRNHAVLHMPRNKMVSVEQTTNLGGGEVWSIVELKDIAATARQHHLVVHMDGARLPNAVVASGVSAKAMCAHVDTTWLDLSKGLGCPIGGVLAGPKTFIDDAWRWKHRLGGAMRQSGILAAAGLYALDHHWDRLAEDHRNAKRLAEVIGNIKGVAIRNPGVPSNLVFIDVSSAGVAAADVVTWLGARGVRMGAMGPTLLRAVTHLDVDADGIETAGRAFASAVKERG
jgi:threonine aldolase